MFSIKRKTAWVLFAKAPLLGYVKTRLQKDTNQDFALKLYQWMLKVHQENFLDILNEIKSSQDNFFCYLAYPSENSWFSSKKVFKKYFNTPRLYFNTFYKKQVFGSLGTRMEHCFETLFKKYDQIVLWGADVPALYLKDFQDVLNNFPDCTIVPAHDGGYCLIALSKEEYKSGCLQNITWSASSTYQEQIKQFEQYKMSYHSTKMVPDLDNVKDIIRNILYIRKQKVNSLKDRVIALQSILENNVDILTKSSD